MFKLKLRTKMKYSLHIFIFLFTSLILSPIQAQNTEQRIEDHRVSVLFNDLNKLTLTINYSKKNILKLTNDSTYISSRISYVVNDDSIQHMDVEIRARGHYRRANCYYVPLWLKTSKKETTGTVFEDDKKVKVVLPCAKSNDSNDHVIKEYLAYKIFETISPFYFQTKLIPIQLNELVNDKIIEHQLLGILIQDDKKLAASYDGEVLKKNIHAKNQDPICSVRNDLFQFMIGNTDYSISYRHNEKLFFIDKKIIPIPYDFDMSGLVNSSYATVSVVNNIELPITRVTQRMYRGFEQNEKVFEQVRQEFLDKEQEVYAIMDQNQIFFKNPKELNEARKFIDGFYDILKDDKKFNNKISKRGRSDLKK